MNVAYGLLFVPPKLGFLKIHVIGIDSFGDTIEIIKHVPLNCFGKQIRFAEGKKSYDLVISGLQKIITAYVVLPDEALKIATTATVFSTPNAGTISLYDI